MTEIALEIQNLTVTYEKSSRPALKDISFEIAKGEFVGVMGANGAGKSTLSLAAMGIIPNFVAAQMSGDVHVLGMNTRDVSVEDIAFNGAGIVFQQPDTQLISISVELEVAFAMENHQFPRDEMRKRIDKALKLVRLAGFEKRAPDQLSGGQKQAVCIAVALTLEPLLIILDEPTSQLDPIGSEIVFEALSEINKNEKIAILIMEHKAELLAKYADRIIVIDEGQMIYKGTPREIFKHSDDLLQRGVPVPQASQLAVNLQREFKIEMDQFPINEVELAPTLIRAFGK